MEICGQYRAKFGAAPIWDEHFGFIWIDIGARKIITYNPSTNSENVYDALGWLRAIIPTTHQEFIGVYKDGLYFLNFQLGTKRPFIVPKTNSEIYYLNSGKCGPNNAIWTGQFDNFFKKFKETKQLAFSNYPFQNTKLYMVTANKDIEVKRKNIGVTQDVAWHTKLNKFYHIDAAKQSIFQYEYTVDHQIRFEQIVYTFKQEEGFPSSVAIDERGFLYVTLFKTENIAAKSKEFTKVVCIDPQQRAIVEQFIIPISHVTSCTIGGPNMRTLFVTTAYAPLAETRIKEEPYAGYALKIPLEYKGCTPYRFQLTTVDVG